MLVTDIVCLNVTLGLVTLYIQSFICLVRYMFVVHRHNRCQDNWVESVHSGTGFEASKLSLVFNCT